MSARQSDQSKLIRTLIREFDFSAAGPLIEEAIRTEPEIPAHQAFLGLLLAFSQKESEALAILPKCYQTPEGKWLGQLLVDHFHCRERMAFRLDLPDPEGFRCLQRTTEITNLDPSKVGIKLSACLIVRDEERFLAQCLSSIKDLVDEIVVVDTGSSDKTVEIAQSYGARIGHFEWSNDFAAARNAALDLATGDWVLWVDADEGLRPEYHATIREALIRPHYSGFNIPITNFMSDEGESDQYVHAPTRLFQRKPGVRFTGRIHEQIAPSLRTLSKPIATLEHARIEHQGYRPSIVQERDKTLRTIRLLEIEVAEEPTNSFQWFNLANAYAIAGRLEEAESACRTCIGTLGKKEGHGFTVYQVLVETLERRGKHEEALEAVEEAVSAGLSAMPLEFARASILFKLGMFDNSLASIDRCLQMSWPTDLQGDYSVATYKRYLLRAQILTVLKRHDEAGSMLTIASKAAPTSVPVRFAQATLLDRKGEHRASAKLYEALSTEPGLEALCLQGMARCAFTLGDAPRAVTLYEQAWRADFSCLDTWVGWVQAAEACGDAATVLQAFEAYVEKQQPSSEILINWGRALQAAGEFERALACFTEALKRDPNDPNAYFNCGDLLYRMGQYADAAHLYEAGLRHTPLNAQGWFVLGNSMAQLGLVDGARLAYRQCLAIQPKHSEAKHNLDLLSESISLAS